VCRTRNKQIGDLLLKYYAQFGSTFLIKTKHGPNQDEIESPYDAMTMMDWPQKCKQERFDEPSDLRTKKKPYRTYWRMLHGAITNKLSKIDEWNE
jgi:hypothetical protein